MSPMMSGAHDNLCTRALKSAGLQTLKLFLVDFLVEYKQGKRLLEDIT